MPSQFNHVLLQVRILADPHGELAKELGVTLEAAEVFGTNRSKRYSALIVDNEIKVYHFRPSAGAFRAAGVPASPPQSWRIYRRIEADSSTRRRTVTAFQASKSLANYGGRRDALSVWQLELTDSVLIAVSER